jgi:hypothetical protein
MLNVLFKEVLDGWVKATEEQFTDHPLAIMLRHDLKDEIKSILLEEKIEFNVKASAGAGNWANVPWLSILDPGKTNSTQDGLYPVYLFRADGSGFYLSLGFGTTKLKELFGVIGAKNEVVRISNKIQSLVPAIRQLAGNVIDLKATTDLGKSYEWASAGSTFYDTNSIPSEDILRKDLISLINIYRSIPNEIMVNEEHQKDTTRPINDMTNTVSLPKPFILLAGLSGTGKTRFVSKQALASRATEKNYCLVSVRPDWHEPSDLLGYVSRLNGIPEYVSTKVLAFIIKAWQVVAPDAGADGYGELNYLAEPFWLCLDEMNLAPVEQYFSDYLSVLESREFDDGRYFCEALLDQKLLQDLTAGGGKIQSELGLYDKEGLWQCFLNHGIAIPPNLIVAGTVNMDETTHGFSRKVIDRAFTFDFGEFFPNDFDSFFDPASRPKSFSYSLNTQAKKGGLSATSDADGEKSIAFLKTVNGILNQTPFELAYRALNELLLQVACFNPSSDAQLQAVWDDFLMAKVLPRIDGDEDKLRFNNGIDSDNLLLALSKLLEVQLNEIWDSNRHDFYRVNIDGSAIDDIHCRSKTKLQWMQSRLEINTFTSFWP